LQAKARHPDEGGICLQAEACHPDEGGIYWIYDLAIWRLTEFLISNFDF